MIAKVYQWAAIKGNLLDPATLVAHWEIHPASESDSNGYWNVPVEIMLARDNPAESAEVLFQYVCGTNIIQREVQATPNSSNLYTAVLSIPLEDAVSGTGTLSVVFRQEEVDYLQPLAKEISFGKHSVSFTPLMERP